MEGGFGSRLGAWTAQRAGFGRAMAWGNVLVSLAAYAGAFVLLHPLLSSGAAALYAIPCAVAGWGFGVRGVILVALLGLPLHVALGIGPMAMPALPDAVAPLMVGVSVGLLRDGRAALGPP